MPCCGPLALGATVLCTSITAEAAGLNEFIGFGDSTMDSGYFRYGPTGGSPGLPAGAPSDTIDKLLQATVAAGGSGAFLGPGVVDTVQLAAKFGLTALPSTYPGGTNYANGSAQTIPTTADDAYSHGLYNNVPIVTQIYNYLAANHEWANTNRTITASLTSIAAPSWSTAAAPIASNWATASAGVAYRINPLVTVAAAASAVFINPQATSYGGELDLNVAF